LALALALPLAGRSRLLRTGGARSGGEGPLLRKPGARSGGESPLLRKFGACIDLEDKCLIPSVLVRVGHAEIRAGTGIPKRLHPTTRAGTNFSKHSPVGAAWTRASHPSYEDAGARCLAMLALVWIWMPGA
jgi:hypothetical protein